MRVWLLERYYLFQADQYDIEGQEVVAVYSTKEDAVNGCYTKIHLDKNEWFEVYSLALDDKEYCSCDLEYYNNEGILDEKPEWVY